MGREYASRVRAYGGCLSAAKCCGVDKLALTADEQAEDVMTPERRSELLEQMRRLVRIEEKEKMLAAP